ncbi:MAG: DUF366 family protein [Cyanobacteria bacterium HKST-UBA06]|nr:DUF366 family protein [Cyanobacteria bacterium HKST-UBA04]MCA9807831.1 DUF366 family protein [Cyanobacteria bacterium HKST-UBA06]MCA9842831.1 DUF366 family protein [Cyanobacteria bacterium HKST-UBA03]
MKHLFIPEPMTYTGQQLSNHWIYKTYGIMGDAVVAFVGPSDIDSSMMVDVEDVMNNDTIYSTQMLNFIVEMFNVSLIQGVLYQRLFSSIIQSRLVDCLDSKDAHRIRRIGDDLFVDGRKKLSVSICTVSPTSILIHTGLNIESAGAPIEAAGLQSELGLDDVEGVAISCMTHFVEEVNDVRRSCCKVKAVF